MARDDRPRIWRGPELPEPGEAPATLLAGIERRLAANPGARIWTVDDEGQPIETDYGSLWPRASAIAEGLRRADVLPGDTIATLTETVPDTVAVFWACLMGGWAFLPLTGRARRARDLARPDILRHVVAQLRHTTIVAAGEFAAEGSSLGGAAAFDLAAVEESGGEALPSAAVAARPVCWLPTSGATGRDKLAGIAESTFLTRHFVRRKVDPRDDEVQMWVYDSDSVAGLNAAFVSLANWVQVSPSSVVARPLLVLDMAARLRVRRIGIAGSLARLVMEAAEQVDETWDLSALSQFAMGGERVDPVMAERLGTLLRRFGAGGVRVTAGYGTTETGSLVTGGEIGTGERTVSLGRPAAGVSLRIVDGDGAPLPEGESGIVEVSAPGLMFARYADAEGEAAGFRPDGWWRTGDLGSFAGGRLSLHGRVAEVISVRGRKVALADVDAVLGEVVNRTHRAVSCRLDGDGGEALGIMVYGPSPPAEPLIRRAVGEHFGLQPARIGHLPMACLPVGAAGKLLRRQVADQLLALPQTGVRKRKAEQAPLAAVWQACLPSAGRPTPESHFFSDGGDSTAAQLLFKEIQARLGVTLRPGPFFADPTFGRLCALVDGSAAHPYVAPARTWALPPVLHGRLAEQMDSWPGERPSPDRLLAGLNTSGTRTPIFWVFQSGHEFAALASALGADQPLYGFRSGHGVFRYDEDTLQMVALSYVQAVLAVCPDGPLFIGGNCQGGRVALAVAQHVMRRSVDVSLLVLMEWGFELSAYHGPVVFLHGRDSLQGNPWLRHAEPQRAWQKWLREVSTDVIPGRHGHYFQRDTVDEVASVIARHLAIRRPAVSLTNASRSAEIVIFDPPRTLVAGQTADLSVAVRNSGSAPWPEGLSLGDYWLDKDSQTMCWCDGRQTVPGLHPGETSEVVLPIRAPDRAGSHDLVVDMVEEGGRWFDRERRGVPVVRVIVKPRRRFANLRRVRLN